MSGTKQSKAVTVASLRALIAGLQAKFPGGQFTLENQALTTTALVQLIESLIEAIEAVNTAQASAKVAVATLRATRAKVGPVALALKRNLLSMFGSAADVLAVFGLVPRKARAKATSDQLAAAKAKAKATRIARGTASKKQKLAVTGNVTGVEIVPVTAPVAPPAQPAPVNAPAAPQAPVVK